MHVLLDLLWKWKSYKYKNITQNAAFCVETLKLFSSGSQSYQQYYDYLQHNENAVEILHTDADYINTDYIYYTEYI